MTVMRGLSLVLALAVATAAGADPIAGSGSTFAHPLIAAWSDGLLEERGGELGDASIDAGVDYEAIGSVAGMMRLNQPDIDFAATDAPLDAAALAERDLAQFPIVVGGLAVVANLPGVDSGELRLPGDVLADIWLGDVTTWSDARIAAANPDLALPDLPVTVVSRMDGSGSTLAFTRFLGGGSAAWRDGPGASTTVDWPAGLRVEGSTRIVETVFATEGAIGYVEFGQASRAGLAAVLVENRAGAFVAPSTDAFALTVAAAGWSGEDGFALDLSGVADAAAYPITTATFALMRRGDRPGRTRRTLYFFDHAFEAGGPRATALGYVPLPPEFVAQVRDYWRRTLPGARSF